MRINNPKSIAGCQRVGNAADVAYNLATVGQVQTALRTLEDNIISKLHGPQNFGLDHDHGYAWLNEEGKVDVTLLPALAITDTHVVTQAELKALADIQQGNEAASSFDQLLNLWLKDQVETHGTAFQKGDIVIVTVGANEVPDPVYAGSYILTLVPEFNTSGNFQFSKLAYTDGNIVKINGLVPSNSAGELRIYLSDILKERYIDTFVSAASGEVKALNATQALENSIYRITTIDEGANGYRFGFIDNSDNGDGQPVPYTKLAEFNEEKAETVNRFAAVNEAIAQLSIKNTEDLAYISGVIGNEDDGANADPSASIIAQTKKLRSDVDDNFQRYERTRTNTNEMLALIQGNVKNLQEGLEKRAVRLYMQEFVWKATEATVELFSETSAQSVYLRSSSDVSGVIHWVHTHSPLNSDTNNTTGLDDTSLIQGTSNVDSQERVLGVYDEDGNQVNVDLKFIKVGLNGLSDTQIIIDTEYVGMNETNPTQFKNTLVGKTWTLLIAKTISGISVSDLTKTV